MVQKSPITQSPKLASLSTATWGSKRAMKGERVAFSSSFFILDVRYFNLVHAENKLLYFTVLHDYSTGKEAGSFSISCNYLHRRPYRRLIQAFAVCITCTVQNGPGTDAGERTILLLLFSTFDEYHFQLKLLNTNRLSCFSLFCLEIIILHHLQITATTIRAKSPPPACFFCSSLRDTNSTKVLALCERQRLVLDARCLTSHPLSKRAAMAGFFKVIYDWLLRTFW